VAQIFFFLVPFSLVRFPPLTFFPTFNCRILSLKRFFFPFLFVVLFFLMVLLTPFFPIGRWYLCPFFVSYFFGPREGLFSPGLACFFLNNSTPTHFFFFLSNTPPPHSSRGLGERPVLVSSLPGPPVCLLRHKGAADLSTDFSHNRFFYFRVWSSFSERVVTEYVFSPRSPLP